MAIRYIQKNDSKKWVITNEKDGGTPLHVLNTRKEALALAHAMAGTEAILVKYSSGWRSENLTVATKAKPAVQQVVQPVQMVQPVAQPVQPTAQPVQQVVAQPVQQVQAQTVNQPTQMIDLSQVEQPVAQPVQQVVAEPVQPVIEEPTQPAVKKKLSKKKVEKVAKVEQPVERAKDAKVSVNQPTQMIQIPKEVIEDNVDEPIIRKVSIDKNNEVTQKVTIKKEEVTKPKKDETKMIVKDEINDTVNIPLAEKDKEKNIKKEIKDAEVNVEQYQPYIKVGWPAWVGILIAVGLIGLFILAIFLIGNNV